MTSVLKNVLAFFVTVVVGLVAGAALLAIETVEKLETNIKRRIERHRPHGR